MDQAPVRSTRPRPQASGPESASASEPAFFRLPVTKLGLAAFALFLSSMPHVASAGTVQSAPGSTCDPVFSIWHIANRAALISARVIGKRDEEAAAANALPLMSVAQYVVQPTTEPPKGGASRPSSTEHRRTGTRRPVDPVPSAQCLATGTCTKAPKPGRPGSDNLDRIRIRPINSSTAIEGSPFPVEAQSNPDPMAASCVASEGLKAIPPALRQKLLALSVSQEANDCASAVGKLAPLREQLRDAYEQSLPDDLSEQFSAVTADYIHNCLGANLLLDQGQLTSAEESFLHSHTGLIVRRNDPALQNAQPVCQAARLGNLVITAQHCIPIASLPHTDGDLHTSRFAFRFFDRPKNYELQPRLFNSSGERNLDYAVMEIVGAPELWEEIEPLVGTTELFADFYDLTANIYMRIANKQTDDTEDLRPSVIFEHSTLCRPAYIDPDGLFLHACQTEAGLSGTPFFQQQNGRLVFVGIHTGVTEALEDRSLAACADGLPNYGVSIPPSALIKIQSR